MESSAAWQSNLSNPPPKRRKVGLACNECRARKVRCDGVHTVCGRCMGRSYRRETCVYSANPHRRPSTRNHSNFDTRARYRIPNTQDTIKVTGSSHHSPSSISPDVHSTSVGDLPRCPLVVRNEVTTLLNDDESVYDWTRASGVNAMMGAVGIEGDRSTHGMFGSSSAADFLHQIKVTIDNQVSAPDMQTPASLTFGRTVRKTHASSMVLDRLLPPRKMADNLMEIYWNIVFPLYPLVDRSQLDTEYTRIWGGEGSYLYDEDILMCIFNTIFALCCQLADFIPPEERASHADSFFSRAKNLLHFNFWHTARAEQTQCLLLMSQYLQSTDSAEQCWNVTGLAIRHVQSLGFHLADTISRFQTLQEQQLAKKTWYGCILLDRVVSLTFGRPTMTSKALRGSVRFPEAIDDEYIQAYRTGDALQLVDKLSMSFFAKSLELYEILDDILSSLYNESMAEKKRRDIHDFYLAKSTDEGKLTIFELDHALSLWSQSLPGHLCSSSSIVSTSRLFQRQGIVLRARYLHIRVVLFRPILSKYCTSQDTSTCDPLISLVDSLPNRFALQCSVTCIKIAQELIQIVHVNLPDHGSIGLLPAWWYNILYIYTAATVLITARLRADILQEIGETSIIESWKRGLEILQKYQKYSSSAKRCIVILELLYERVTSSTTAAEPPFGRDESSVSNDMHNVSLGEGVNMAMLEGLDLIDWPNMSWLNSEPSNMY